MSGGTPKAPNTVPGINDAPTGTETLTREEAQSHARIFLENAPLFKPLRLSFKNSLQSYVTGFHSIAPRTIHLYCANSNCVNLESTTWLVMEQHPLAIYKCQNCQESRATFWIESVATKSAELMNPGGRPFSVMAEGIFRKLGQQPTWAPKIPKRLLKNLGPSATLFRRGVACLQEGLGIGASAYFRRVIEEEVKTLLELAERAAILDDDQAALDNIRVARESQVASDRLKIAVQKVPRTLRPGNANPLAVLYGALSGAVHQEPEDVALETASRLLKTFVFLFEELKERMDAAETYAADLQVLKQGSANRK
ncbi:hypothetical protein [Corallococcus exercitus]|uniref:Uncharacterized protein n=1 Tax=Corallococcus exercitus TaxID=2316736 RepID=A0A7Y4JMD0_9BACT|nr:hypothetical protein [Corallococcus exercitus]NOK07695.1 hypothetical protein [Corallococcus exercitus]